MSTVPLKFGPLYQNDDEAALIDGSTVAMHDSFFIVNNGSRTWHRRPGMRQHVNLGTAKPVDGLFWWDKKQCTIAVSDGRVFVISDNNGTVSEITGDRLGRMRRPSFATDGDTLLIANGGRIVFTDGTTATAYIASENAPVNCSFVAWIDTYFIASFDGTDKYGYSSVGNNPDTWAALDFEVSMSSPDNTVAMKVDNGEILLFGSESVEVHYNDGVSPFARNDAATMNHGCIAPYSAMKVKGAWFWLNERRELVTPNGRTPTAISNDIARVLQGIEEVSDAKADIVTISGQTFYLLDFPTDGKTLVYNITAGEWSGEWGYYKDGEYKPWLGNCVAYASRWNQHLVGSRIDGNVFVMDEDADDAGVSIRASIKTCNISHGTTRPKQCHQMRMIFKRIPGVSPSGKIMLRYREAGSSLWKNERWVDVVDNTDSHNLYVDLRRLGIYEFRQYELVMTDFAPLVFMGAEEEVDVL